MTGPLTRLGWAVFAGSLVATVVSLVSILAGAPRVWPGALVGGLMVFGTVLATSGRRRVP